MTQDILGVFGFGVMTAGIYVRYGADVACIIGGAILLALAVIGAIRK